MWKDNCRLETRQQAAWLLAVNPDLGIRTFTLTPFTPCLRLVL